MPDSTEQRKLAAIMFTDMVGYSALSQRDEALALELLGEQQRLLRTQFALFNGREVKVTGDGFLVEFPSALEATQCAIETQRAIAARNATQPAERHIRVRVGIHVGDVVHREADMYGDGVNIAARIEPLAQGGGICLSETVYAQVQNKLKVPLQKLELTQLKNIETPMEVYRVVLPWETGVNTAAGRQSVRKTPRSLRWFMMGVAALVAFNTLLFWRFIVSPGPSQSTPKLPSITPEALKSIAVLPFVNMSADKDNEYFSDGITEEILNALARTPGLRVAARTSAFSFKGKNESVQRIGEALNVSTLLEGSVRRAGNQLRITAQLINVADGFHLWSDTFDRKAEDVFTIQTEVAQRVQEALKLKLRAAASPNATLVGTDNLEAYDLYLRARQFWNQRTGADVHRAIGLFQQAIEKDPKFATAYAGLASSYVLLPDYASVPVREAIPKARAAARRALELDGRLAEAHTVLGMCLEWDWDLAGAENEYTQASRLNPNYATTYHWHSWLMRALGKTNEALAEIRKAQTVDPLSAVIQDNLGCRLLDLGQYDAALAEIDKALQLSPEFVSAHVDRGNVLLAQKKVLQAIVELEKTRDKAGDMPAFLANLGYAYARDGRTNEARQILEKLKGIAAGGGAPFWPIAFVHLGLGEMDQAFVWLERATESRMEDPRVWKTDPLMADVVKDPRYAALLKKFRLDK